MARQGKKEYGACAHGAFRPNFSTMTLNNPFDRGKSNAGSRKIVFVVQALKRLEEFIRERHIETRTIVPYKISGASGLD